jgi:hypothetical protein
MSTRSGLRSLTIAAFVPALLAVLPARGADPALRPGLPSGVSADWWSKAQRSIQLEQYGIVGGGADGARFLAANPAHHFQARFDAAGVSLVPTGGAPWEWRLSLRGWGRAGALNEPGVPAVRAGQDRVDFDRGPLAEWFVNSPQGLEHGFTVPVRPELEGNGLALDLAVEGGLRPVFAPDGKAVDFYSTGSVSVLRYGKLVVTDAVGADVPARMEPIAGGIRIAVEDSGAIYPLTIDPLATTPSWTIVGEHMDDQLGESVASAGDVNGDGYADIIVGAYVNSNYNGKVYLFLGGPSGPSTTPSWTAVGAGGEEFGESVASAGDVNKDGYADVIIGAPNYSHNTIGGKAYVFLGGPGGLSTTPAWTAVGEAVNEDFGYAVASAGDVNKDGYADVIVGGYNYNSGTGKAYLYRGSASGLSTTASWTAVGEMVSDQFGRVVGTAGDVNKDGYADVIIGAPGWDGSPTGNSFIGRVYLYTGSASGLSATAAAIGTGEHASDYYGWSAGTAGDVNKDGYADIVVGAYGYPGQGYGKVYVYYGKSSLTNFFGTPSWSVLGQNLGMNSFGFHVATAGDVNKDGYADVVISSGLGIGVGYAQVFLGGASGLATTPSWTAQGDTTTSNQYGYCVATAGDVNGDGYADVLVGDSGTNYNTGAAYLYLGGPNVDHLAFASNKTTITWVGQCTPSLYDVVRGALSDLPNFSLATCLENDSTDASTTDTTTPAAGKGFYYLVSCNSPKSWDDNKQRGSITACP